MNSRTHKKKKRSSGKFDWLVPAVVVFIFLFSVLGPAGVGILTASAKEIMYMINDNGQISYFQTSTTDPEDVLTEAGLTLGIDDLYTTKENGQYTGIYVQRVQMVTVNNGGQILKIGTYGETVEQLLQRMNISLDENDEVSVPLDTVTADGLEVVINRMIYDVETYARALPYETVYVDDPTLAKGETRVVTAGTEGEMLCTARVTYANNVEVERELLSSQITTEAVTEVIALGTGLSDKAVTGELIIGDGVIITPEGDILTYTERIDVLATAYCDKGLTAIGTQARYGAIAVDPSVIPYGTRMYIVSTDGQYIYGVATAEDTGHPDFICGYRIDLWYEDYDFCMQFGARDCQVYILGSN